jgi:F-type H+-transporting ATPase subunit b
MLTFAVLIWFVMRFLWEPMTRMLEDRGKRIADGLAAGERGRHELELAEQRASERLREAKQQAAELIAQANKRANQIIEEAKQQGRLEGQRQLEATRAEIEQEVNRAKEHLREQVVALALSAAEKVLEKEVNATVHGEFVAKLAKKL